MRRIEDGGLDAAAIADATYQEDRTQPQGRRRLKIGERVVGQGTSTKGARAVMKAERIYRG
jgi:hypothetical protein